MFLSISQENLREKGNSKEKLSIILVCKMVLATLSRRSRCIYYEALDLIICGIKNQFDQPGFRLYSNLEALLVKSAKKDKFDEEFQFVVNFSFQRYVSWLP